MQFKVLDRWQGTNFTSFTLCDMLSGQRNNVSSGLILSLPLRLSMRILLKSQQCLLPTVLEKFR